MDWSQYGVNNLFEKTEIPGIFSLKCCGCGSVTDKPFEIIKKYRNKIGVLNREKTNIMQWNWTIVGRFLTGMGLGMTLTIPNVYIVEVTDPQYRGVLGVLPNLFCQLGIFVTYVIGQWLDWSELAFACM